MSEERLTEHLKGYGAWFEDQTGLELRPDRPSTPGSAAPARGSEEQAPHDRPVSANGDRPPSIDLNGNEDTADGHPLELTLVEPGPGDHRRRGQTWVRAALAVAAAILLIVGGISIARDRDKPSSVVASGGDGATTVAPLFDESLLDAIVQDGAEVSVGPVEPVDLEGAWQFPERDAVEVAVFEDAGYMAGLTASFSQILAQGDPPPDGGFTAAYRFRDDDGASAALTALEEFYRHPENGTDFGARLGPLLPKEDLDVTLGDQATAFVVTSARRIEDVTIVLWRTDNVVHVVWAIQLADIPDGHASVVRLAEEVAARMPA